MSLSPIVIFGFNRPKHMENMLESLCKNTESKESKVIFFIDGYDDKNNELIHETLEIAKKNWGFSDKTINLREKNLSLNL